MGSEWETTTVGALLGRDGGSVKTGPFGTVLKSAEYSTDGVPLISVGEVGYGSLEVRPSTPRAPREVVERLPEYLLESGDIVFGRKGAVDRSAHVRAEQAGWFLGSDGIRLRLPSTCDSRFVAYHLQSPSTRSWLIQHATGSTMPSLNQNTIERIPIALPPIQEQRRIAGILGALDDKIELNRRTSQTLESMARALFKSWFVDFDPVRAKAEGLQTQPSGAVAYKSPASPTDTSDGALPEGWFHGSLSDLIEVMLGGDWGSEEPADATTEASLCIRGADIPDLQRGGRGAMPIRFLDRSSLDKRQLADGDLVIEVSGGSPTQSTGRAVLVSDELLRRLGRPLSCSNFCRLVKLRSRHTAEFTYLWLRWLYDNDELLQYETGTTGIKNFAISRFAEKHGLAIPPAALLEAFSSVARPLFQQRQRLGAQSDVLTETRAGLLPWLLAGNVQSAGRDIFYDSAHDPHVGRLGVVRVAGEQDA
jgi:type I restriction enzyme S subunit